MHIEMHELMWAMIWTGLVSLLVVCAMLNVKKRTGLGNAFTLVVFITGLYAAVVALFSGAAVTGNNDFASLGWFFLVLAIFSTMFVFGFWPAIVRPQGRSQQRG